MASGAPLGPFDNRGWRGAGIFFRRLPDPSILPPVLDQRLSHGVLQNVFDLYVQTFGRTNHAVERLFLPDGATTPPCRLIACADAPLIAFMISTSEIIAPAAFIRQWNQNQMNMVGHHHCHFQAIPLAVIVDATSQHDIASPIWQDAAKLGAERDEMRRVVALHVGQVPTIELHRRILPRVLPLANPGCAKFAPCDNLTNCPGHLAGIRGILVPVGRGSPNAGVAQSVEHLICNQGVGGSNPFASSSMRKVRKRISGSEFSGRQQNSGSGGATGFSNALHSELYPACSDLRAVIRKRDSWFPWFAKTWLA